MAWWGPCIGHDRGSSRRWPGHPTVDGGVNSGKGRPITNVANTPSDAAGVEPLPVPDHPTAVRLLDCAVELLDTVPLEQLSL